jgi:hypothetical protein
MAADERVHKKAHFAELPPTSNPKLDEVTSSTEVANGARSAAAMPLPQRALAAAVGAAAPLASTEGRDAMAQRRDIYSIHGEQAAKRRAIAELIFFAGTNDLRRCKQLAATWSINVTDASCMDYDKRTPL